MNCSSVSRCVPPSVRLQFCFFVLLARTSSDVFSLAFEGSKDARLLSGLSCGLLVLVGSTSPFRCLVPSCPFHVRVLDSTNSNALAQLYLPSPKPGHTTGGSGRGSAWPGRKGRRLFGSPRRHLSLVPTRVPKTIVLNVSSEARKL